MLKLVLTVLILACAVSVQSQRQELSFQDGNYILGWEVDPTETFLTVDALVKTTGWVGFGISNREGFGMPESDIIIAGFDEYDGFNYFGDFYAPLNGPPSLDTHQDGTLLEITQSDGTTFIKFQRDLVTGDPNVGQDVDISSSTFLLWAYGNSDIVQYHLWNAGKVNQMGIPSH